MTRDTRPVIGVTADLSEAPGKLDNYQESTLFVPQRYLSAIEQAGAIALVLPPNQSEAALHRMIGLVDGLVITGGNFDIQPRYYCERPVLEIGAIKARRTKVELGI